LVGHIDQSFHKHKGEVTMRAYNVQIVANLNGREIRFVEVIAFPLQSTSSSGCVDERDREAGAIEQVRIKYPQLQNVRAEWSRHVSNDDFDKGTARPFYIKLPC